MVEKREFYASGRWHHETIFVEDGKIVQAHYESTGRGGGGYNPYRGKSYFESCLDDCMRSMINDNLSLFKDFLRYIKDTDPKYFEKGKALLDAKAAEFRL